MLATPKFGMESLLVNLEYLRPSPLHELVRIPNPHIAGVIVRDRAKCRLRFSNRIVLAQPPIVGKTENSVLPQRNPKPQVFVVGKRNNRLLIVARVWDCYKARRTRPP